MGNFCSFGPPNEPSPPSVRRVKPEEKAGPEQFVTKLLPNDPTTTSSSSTGTVTKTTTTTIKTTTPARESALAAPTIITTTTTTKKTTSAKENVVAPPVPATTTTTTTTIKETIAPVAKTFTPTTKPTLTKETIAPVAKTTTTSSKDVIASPTVIPTTTTTTAVTVPTPSAVVPKITKEVIGPASSTQTKTSKTCAKCEKVITGTMVEAMNKEYHEACFVCASCKGELAGRFAVIDGSPFCPSCAVTANKNRKGSSIRQSPSTNSSTNEKPSGGSRIGGGGGSGIQGAGGSRIGGGGGSGIQGAGGSRIGGGSKIQTGQMGLLQWCKNRTVDYNGVEIKDFVKSWQDGLAFCALLHSYRPDLIDFNALSANDKEKNIALAFAAAEKLDIPQLLDPEDFALEKLSMMTYLSAIYEVLGKVKVSSD